MEQTTAPPLPPPPPPPPPYPLPPRGQGKWPLLVVGGVAVLALAAAAVLVARRGAEGPSAAETLERAQDAMLDAGSFRLRSTATDRSSTGDSEGAGTEYSSRVVTEAEVAGSDWRARADEGGWLSEAVAVDGDLYLRSEATEGALADVPWELVPDEPMSDEDIGDLVLDDLDPEAEDYVVSTLGAMYLGDFSAAAGLAGTTVVAVPDGLVEAFEDLSEVEIVSRAGGEMRLRGVRHPPAALRNSFPPAPAGEFEIVLDGDYLPKALRVTVDGVRASYVNEISFAGWGTEITVDVPEGEIDETPWIDEQALAETAEGLGPMVWPTVVPDGLGVTDITPYFEDETAEDCDQITLTYSPPLDDEEAYEEWLDSADYLAVYLMPLDCALDYDDRPFAAGDFGPALVREVDGVLQVQVDTTVVVLDTTYEDDLPAMVASLQPFDLDAEIERIAEEGGTSFTL